MVLASAAGIVASTVSHSNFTDNNITGTPRWGIAIRSNGDSISYGNRVERNRLVDLARSTRDLGGLSFIGEGHTGTLVRHNCVRRAVGLDTDPSGKFNTPFYTWGIYLDNWSSNFTVDSNIFHTNVLGGIFVHGGSNNTITNNIAFNSSNASMPPLGAHGHCAASSGVLFGAMRSGPTFFGVLTDNTWRRNIVLAAAGPGAQPMAIVETSEHWLNFSKHFGQGFGATHNTYWSPISDLRAAPDVTPLGSWKAWQAAGHDAQSRIADPLFIDPENGNFGLRPGSPALKSGFVPLPEGLDQC